MGKIWQEPYAAGALSALNSSRFATKQYTRDEDDGEEDAFAGCIWRGMTTSSRTDYLPRLLEDVQSVHVVRIVILCTHANPPRRLFKPPPPPPPPPPPNKHLRSKPTHVNSNCHYAGNKTLGRGDPSAPHHIKP